jgi:hypothetical protein
MVDRRTVELAKIRSSQGANKSKIARELNISARTVGRYLQLDDDPEFAEELAGVRRANQTKFITDGWRIGHKALEICEAKLNDPKTSAKDAATIAAILMDKIQMMENFGARKVEEDLKVTFIVGVEDGNTGKTLPEPGEILQLTGKVPGDDRGEGERQDILPVLRGNEAEHREPGDPGGDSSLNVPLD